MNGVFIMFDSLKIKRLSSKMKNLILVKKDYNKTIECANEILELDENNLFALKCKSDALRQLGDFEGALECANVIVDLEPTSFNYSNQAVILYLLGDIEGSFEILDHFLKSSNDFTEAFNNKSIFLYELGRVDEVLELCDFILEKDPTFINALSMKSKVYYDKNEYDLALDSINKACGIDSNNEWINDMKKQILDKLNE